MYAHLTQGATAERLGGRIYTGQTRPLDDEGEALVLQTIALSHDTPQTGRVSMVLYVPDLYVERGGRSQRVANKARLSELSACLLEDIRGLGAVGLMLDVEREAMYTIEETKSHAIGFELGLLTLL